MFFGLLWHDVVLQVNDVVHGRRRRRQRERNVLVPGVNAIRVELSKLRVMWRAVQKRRCGVVRCEHLGAPEAHGSFGVLVNRFMPFWREIEFRGPVFEFDKIPAVGDEGERHIL